MVFFESGILIEAELFDVFICLLTLKLAMFGFHEINDECFASVLSFFVLLLDIVLLSIILAYDEFSRQSK